MTDESCDERTGIHWPPGQRPRPGQKGLVYEITATVDAETGRGRIVAPDGETGARITLVGDRDEAEPC